MPGLLDFKTVPGSSACDSILIAKITGFLLEAEKNALGLIAKTLKTRGFPDYRNSRISIFNFFNMLPTLPGLQESVVETMRNNFF